MEPVIIVSGVVDTQAVELVEALTQIGLCDITLYGAVDGHPEFSSASIINPIDATLCKAAGKVAGKTYERITIINRPCAIDPRYLSAAVETLKVPRRGVTCIQAAADPSCLHAADLSIEDLVARIADGVIHIPEVFSIPASLLHALPEEQELNASEMTLRIIIAALASGEEIETIDGSPFLNSSVETSLHREQICRLLRFAIAECNIEDLFPNHAWSAHEEESLSFCYHTLAGIFLRFGDLESASDCLTTSEQFEDSPRLLALRGMVALLRGRSLEAVANLVSSLQQYEERKRNDGSHYLTFTPNDYEQMNSDLKDGLEALYRRDNEKAFKAFSKAVFNFDSFYREIGLEPKAYIN